MLNPGVGRDIDFAALHEEVLPAEVREVTGESAQLPPGRPDRWLYGYVLRGVMSDHRGRDDTPVPGALHAGTLHLRMGGRRLEPGIDYLADGYWGVLTRLRDLDGEVSADYTHGLLRVDSVFRGPGGEVSLVTGVSDLSNPHPPVAADRATRIANVYIPYQGPVEVLPIRRGPSVHTRPQPHRLTRTAQRLAGGHTIRVTCWGDSVTAGASSSSAETAYPQLLAGAFAASGHSVAASTVAIPGTNLRQWLGWEQTPLPTDWAEVVDSRPDLLVVEFVNDAELPPDCWESVYRELLARIAPLGCDLLLTTPHFTRLDWMGNLAISDPDRRPYVVFLREFAETHGVALADISRAWEDLYAQGIPYPTLLRNGINHPDDRGHHLYAAEISAAIGLVRPGKRSCDRLPGSGLTLQ